MVFMESWKDTIRSNKKLMFFILVPYGFADSMLLKVECAVVLRNTCRRCRNDVKLRRRRARGQREHIDEGGGRLNYQKNK